MKIPKNVCQNLHFKQRVKERYGLDINSRDRYDMLRQVQNGSATCIVKLSHSRTVFIVKCKEKELRVVYDRTRKTFRTALPFDGPVIWNEQEHA